MHDVRRVETTIGSIATYELGTADPVAFLWPSLYTDHESLMPLAIALARTRRCILVDGPGHGQSAVPLRRYTLADCAHAAVQLLDARGVESVDWIGNAWGGHVGVSAALSTPSRLRSLTVIGSPMEALSPAMRLKSRAALWLLRLGARGLVGRLVAKTMIAPTSLDSHREYVRRCVSEAPVGGIEQAVTSISLGRADLTAELSRIAIPTLFIAGTADPMWSVEVATSQAAHVPHSRFETVAGAAHLAPLEQPEATHLLISSFLGARDSSTSGRP